MQHQDRLGRRRFVQLGLAAAVSGCATPREIEVARGRASDTPRRRGDEPADVVIRGGTIWTFDATRPTVEALAIADGIIVALGDQAEVQSRVGGTTAVVDLGGGLAVPGLTDAHAHLVGLGRALEEVDLRGAKSIEEVVKRLREQAPPSGWIAGRGWDQNLWPGAAMPDHKALSAAFPDRPVWLRRVDGHAGWGNGALLEAAGIDKKTKAPAGGEILRDRRGQATGVLIDAAMGLVPAPPASKADVRRHILAGAAHAAQRGLTGVHEMGIPELADEVYRELASAGGDEGLSLRVHAYAAADWFARDLQGEAPDPIRQDSMYTLAGVKMYADGALGSRGAALLEPYSDRDGHTGLMQQEPAAFKRLVEAALKGGWQVATHAIGDAANRSVLDTYEDALSRADNDDARLRIEHCQIVAREDIPRFSKLGVIASMQPTHATSDMPWVPARIGEDRLERAYAWQAFLESGAHLAFGSDFPVELVDVTHGLYAAMTRQDAHGQPAGGWLPDQRVSLEQAVRSFSLEAAYAAHREAHLGRLALGYRGDVTCFADLITELTPAELRDAKIAATIVDGTITHRA